MTGHMDHAALHNSSLNKKKKKLRSGFQPSKISEVYKNFKQVVKYRGAGYQVPRNRGYCCCYYVILIYQMNVRKAQSRAMKSYSTAISFLSETFEGFLYIEGCRRLKSSHRRHYNLTTRYRLAGGIFSRSVNPVCAKTDDRDSSSN